MMTKLPESWSWTTLEDVVDIRDDLRKPVNSSERAFRSGPYPYYGATGQVGWIDDYMLDGEYVLLGEDGAPFFDSTKPKAYIISGKCWVNNHAHVLIGHGDMLRNRFLLHWLNVVDYHGFANGTTRLKLTQSSMRGMPVPMAPFSEQDRITQEIETQFSRLDAGVAALKKVQAGLKRYRTSVLHAACEGRLVPTEAEHARAEGRDFEPADELLKRILVERRAKWEADQLAKMQSQGKPPKDDKWKSKYQEPTPPDTSDLPDLPDGWCWASVEQLGAHEPNSITDGPFGSNLKTSHYTSAGPRVIRLQNIGDGVFVDERAHISDKHYETLAKHSIYAGDLVIAAFGARPPRSCIIPPSVGPAIVKADCIRFRPSRDVAVVGYINCTLNSESTRERTVAKVHGVGRPRLNLGEIKAIPLPMPPLVEQERIVAEVERRLSVIDELETTVTADLKRAERLRQAILKRAFEGKLVPQDPNDEPASALLTRIKAEREKGTMGRMRRNRTDETDQTDGREL